MPTVSEYMTRREVQLYLHISRFTVDRFVNKGMLTRYAVPGSNLIRYKRSQVESLLVEMTEKPANGN